MIKYGGGSEAWRGFLTSSSKSVAAYEELEMRFAATLANLEAGSSEAQEIVSRLARLRKPITDGLNWAIACLDVLKGKKQ